MPDHLLLGFGPFLIPLPGFLWRREVVKNAQRAAAGLAFMSPEHHQIRNFVVRELPRRGEPLSPEFIARHLDLPLGRVTVILIELEQHLTFLFRNEQGSVAWAYPVTTDRTPHQLLYSSGEQGYAAWAVDAIATPFVQGRLRTEALSVIIRTACAHCGRPICFELDSELSYRGIETGAKPLVFSPLVDFARLAAPSIINAFWRNSLFFWSEEHARAYRPYMARIRGIYLTLPQSVYLTQRIQGALFAFR